MKYIITILLAIGVIALVMLCIPKSCTSTYKPSLLEVKSDKSLDANSIQTAETSKILQKYDSLFLEKEKQDSIHKVKIKVLSTSYYQLRYILKGQKLVKIDSANQVVDVPAIEYNTSVSSGSMCDSLLMYQDQELAIKDSIISDRDIEIVAIKKEVATGKQALSDLIALKDEEKKKLEKAKVWNKRIPLISAISAFAGSMLTIFLLK